jgi:methionyl-tRNA formyltransferase
MGTPDFAVPSLEVLADSVYEIAAVYTQPDRGSGRGRRLVARPVKQVAIARGLRVLQPIELRDKESIEVLANLTPELIVVAAYGHILPPEVLKLPRYGCVNVHPSLLPKYRGSSPIASAILQGEKVTGVTIMLLDEGVDTGPLLRQVEVPISDEDTTGTLTAKLATIGARLLLDTLSAWVEGRLVPQPQDESQATYSRQIIKEDGEIDWRLSTLDLWRRVRAFEPWPGSYTRWSGKRLKVIKAVPLSSEKTGEEGKVIALQRSSTAPVGVITGDGVLGLLTVQLEGKKEMSATEFLLGQRTFINSSLL